MNVLLVGSERKLFDATSEARRRITKQGSIVDELHIIVFTRRGTGLLKQQIAPNVWVYATNSHHPLLYVYDAYRMGKKIERMDLVSAQDPFECGLAGYLLARELKLPLQLQVHTDPFAPEFVESGMANRIRLYLAKWLIAKTQCLRLVSERVQQSFAERGLLEGAISSVLPVRVDLSDLDPSRPPVVNLKEKYPYFKFIILMVSRLAPEKRLQDALRAFNYLAPRYPMVGLVIVGEGKERKKLDALVKELGLQNRVVFEGWQDEIASYYQTADVYLLTSEFEGFGRTLIEAATLHCPIVTTNVGIVGSVLADEVHCLVCPVGDIECIATKVHNLIESFPLRVQLKEAAAAAVAGKFQATDDEYLAAMKESFDTCYLNSMGISGVLPSAQVSTPPASPPQQ